jgi:hypothetical protein
LPRKQKNTVTAVTTVAQAGKISALDDGSVKMLTVLAAEGLLSQYLDDEGDTLLSYGNIQDADLCEHGSLHVHLAIPL